MMTENEEKLAEHDLETDHAELVHEKRLRCLELRKAGCTYEEIATTVGFKGRTVAFRAVARLLETRAEEPTEFVRKIELERLNSLMTAIWQKARQGDLEAIDRALAIHQRICAITGIEGAFTRQFAGQVANLPGERQVGNLPHELEIAPSEAPHGDRPDRLMQQLMEKPSGPEQDTTSAGAPTRLASAKLAPPKSAPARGAPQEKPAAPLPKTKPKAADDEAAPRVSPRYWITLSVLALVLAAVWGIGSRGNPNPDQLARTALTDPDKAARVDAAAALTMVKQPDPTVLLRQLAEKSHDPEVLVHALNGLSGRGDNASLPMYIGALEHADAMVRAAAWAAVQKFYYNNVPEGLKYDVDAPPDERTRVARRLKEIRDELLAKLPKDAKA